VTPELIRQAVILAVAETVRIPAADVESSGSLLDLPGFDSITVVTVLERLEDAFGIEVPAESIVPEAFESVATVTELIVGALSGAPAIAPVPPSVRSRP
jgi:acyl carrier protein